MIFLRLLRPGVIAKPDAELLPAFGKTFLVGERPWHEFSADLSAEDRFERRLERGPALEIAFGAWPQHAVYPIQHMRRAAFDQGARGRIGPHLVELTPESEVTVGRSSAEQKGALRQMVFEQLEHIAKTGLDLGRRLRIGADEPEPIGHAGADRAGEVGLLLFAPSRRAHAGDSPRRADLVDVARPAIVKHPFVAPLVAELLDQGGDKTRHTVAGMDGRLGEQLFHLIDDWSGILDASALRRYHQRNDRQLGIFFIISLARRIAQNPLMRNAFIAKIGAYLDRIRRHLGAEDAIEVRHALMSP